MKNIVRFGVSIEKARSPWFSLLPLVLVASFATIIGGGKTMTVSTYFSATYPEARAKFLEACEKAGAVIENRAHPEAGPDGNPLFTDVALLGSENASTVLVLSSGTHGVEGFCGSGLQTALLGSGLAERLPDGVRLVLIHAINPYGFAWLRRFNEDNVDLNRNFVDHSQPYPENPAYDELADAIAPKDFSKEAAQKARATLLARVQEQGLVALQAVITRGQYTHPDGLHFGGRFATWSNKTLHTIVSQHMSSAKRVVMIDFHTGLGKYGAAEIIMSEPIASSAYRRAENWWGDRVKSTVLKESVSAHLSGTLKLAIPRILPEAHVTTVALEFGTAPPMEVFFAMQAENWLHNHSGPQDPRWKPIKAALRRVFYPDTDDWKQMVWGHTEEVIDQALTGLSAK